MCACVIPSLKMHREAHSSGEDISDRADKCFALVTTSPSLSPTAQHGRKGKRERGRKEEREGEGEGERERMRVV